MWTFANWPRDLDALKSFLVWTGFPWPFAYWEWGRLAWFDPLALAADIALGAGAVAGVAILSAWSRHRSPEPPPNPPPLRTGRRGRLNP